LVGTSVRNQTGDTSPNDGSAARNARFSNDSKRSPIVAGRRLRGAEGEGMRKILCERDRGDTPNGEPPASLERVWCSRKKTASSARTPRKSRLLPYFVAEKPKKSGRICGRKGAAGRHGHSDGAVYPYHSTAYGSFFRSAPICCDGGEALLACFFAREGSIRGGAPGGGDRLTR
jgi:hypothetical protein